MIVTSLIAKRLAVVVISSAVLAMVPVFGFAEKKVEPPKTPAIVIPDIKIQPKAFDDGRKCSGAEIYTQRKPLFNRSARFWDRGPVRRVLSWPWRGRPWCRR